MGPPLADSVVARLAEVVRSETAVERHRAAVLALPINLNIAMLGASSLSSADLLEEAVLADQVLRLGVLGLGTLHLAIDEATEVRLLAGVALKDRAAVHGVLERLLVVDVAWSGQSFVLKDALFLSALHGKGLSFLFNAHKRSELGCDWLRESLAEVDLCVAARALEEAKGHADRCPLALEEVHKAVCVEDVAAGEL